MQTPAEFGTGSHDAVVVDALWGADDDGRPTLTLSLTMLGGALKGGVVEVAFADASPALARALTVLGVGPANVHDHEFVAAAVLGMPCTLVVVQDGEGAIGYALDP